MMILLLSAFIATVIFLMLAFLFLHSSGEARGIKRGWESMPGIKRSMI